MLNYCNDCRKQNRILFYKQNRILFYKQNRILFYKRTRIVFDNILGGRKLGE